jgi:hypothetical protein
MPKGDWKNLYMGLLAKLFRNPNPKAVEEPTLVIRLIGGPLDGGSREIRRDEILYTEAGVLWKAKWRVAVYVFDRAPDCSMGRFVGWEKTNA